jgi:hypothetical protein
MGKIDTLENLKFISKNSSNGGGWKKFSKENVGNVSYVLNMVSFWNSALCRPQSAQGIRNPHFIR